jgi:hypothetical protein
LSKNQSLRAISPSVGGFVVTKVDPRGADRNGDGRPHLHEWDKDDLDALGILASMGLGMLTCIRKASNLSPTIMVRS